MTPSSSSQQKRMEGFFGLLACHVGVVFLLLVIGWLVSSGRSVPGIYYGIFIFVLGIGLFQLTYVVPLCIWLRRQRKLETLKGVMDAAIFTFLLCVGGFVLLTASL